MEPFGLFQFLQSLLNSTPEATKSADGETQNEVTQKTDAPTASTHKNTTKTDVDNAYLHFITDHEKRVHNTKK